MLNGMTKLVIFSLLALALSGCATSDEDFNQTKQDIKDRIKEQQERARKADHDLQKSAE